MKLIGLLLIAATRCRFVGEGGVSRDHFDCLKWLVFVLHDFGIHLELYLVIVVK